jgi:hypothetical protein
MATFIKGVGDNGCCGCRTDPCVVPQPTLYVDSISASHTKCGYDEFGTASTPPKVYSTKSQSGGLTNVNYLGSGYYYTNQWGGSVSVDRFNCTENSDSRYLTVSVSGGCTYSTTVYGTDCKMDYDGVYPYSGANANGLFVWGVGCSYPWFVQQLFGCSGPTVINTTQKKFALASCDPGGGYDVTLDLSTEYTTSLLISDTESLLPSWPNTFSSGYTSSYRNLTNDELTYTIRRIKYKFQLPTLTGYSCYKITWFEGSTAKSYLWNGTDTETPVYTLNEPLTNGTVSVNTVVASCSCT